VLVFEAPPEQAAGFNLELPGEAVGQPGVFRVYVAGTMVER
jgi:hypothetical protein